MSPISIIIIAVVLGFMAVGAAALIVQQRRKNYAWAWYFDRQRNVRLIKGESFAGLVSFADGGFIERETAELDMRIGRPYVERGDVRWRRNRRPIFLIRAGDSAPLEFDPDGTVKVNNVSADEYDQRVDLASELAVADAAERGNRGEFLGVALGGTLLLLGLATAAIGAAIAAKGAL